MPDLGKLNQTYIFSSENVKFRDHSGPGGDCPYPKEVMKACPEAYSVSWVLLTTIKKACK